ncbi:hypothetical protein LB465_15465 [Salegentibacter sp. LM13S]|uniref:hypothetical protein n=1 Tax=Salegentibacter lacus TaxID=2873599 RepID=UPI001CCEBEE3|nr:hypothetical protein [Salegentibacter lacus]MBZ9632180.1 hypothetical protein [Salegentibacter lacus]
MRKYYLIILVTLLTGCCKEEVLGEDPLSDYEKELIPYNGYDEIEYLNEDGQIILAQSTPTKIESDRWKPGPESCSFTEYERSYSHLFFSSEDFTLKLEINKSYDGEFTIEIGRGESYIFSQGCRIFLDQPIEERITNISLAGDDFTNVLVFENCSADSKISKILYSSEKGIEYLEFSNGSFYKIN